MLLFGFPLIDIVAIALYFLLVLGIGIWASTRIRSEEDYFMGGRRFGKFIQSFAAFGQSTSADSAVSTPDYIWGVACRELLGPLNLGLYGLMVACLMAALMSTADCLMLTVSSLMTNNVYAVFLPRRSQQHYIWVGRVFGLLFIAGGVIMNASG